VVHLSGISSKALARLSRDLLTFKKNRNFTLS
jgi:hypothetical protein